MQKVQFLPKREAEGRQNPAYQEPPGKYLHSNSDIFALVSAKVGKLSLSFPINSLNKLTFDRKNQALAIQNLQKYAVIPPKHEQKCIYLSKIFLHFCPTKHKKEKLTFHFDAKSSSPI